MAIEWKKVEFGKRAWGISHDHWDYAVDVYDHGRETIVTAMDQDGENHLYQGVADFKAGLRFAERHDRARSGAR